MEVLLSAVWGLGLCPPGVPRSGVVEQTHHRCDSPFSFSTCPHTWGWALKVESLFLLFFKLPLCAWKDSASQGGNLGMQVLALHPEEPACNGEVTALQGQEWCWGLAQQAVAILGPADLGG